LDDHADVRKRNADLLTPGDVIAEMHALLGTLGGLPAQVQTLLAQSSGAVELTADAAGDSEDARANAEIDRAGRYLEQGKLDVAAELLDDVEKQFGARLSHRARFRVIANRGHVLRLRGDAKGAAKLYIEAKQHQADDRDARFLEALAQHLTGEDETARRLASDLRRDFPDFARASLLEIVTAPQSTSYADLVASVPAAHRDNAEVPAAMARKAIAEGDFAAAEAQARRAHGLEPNWVEPMLVLADAIVEGEFGNGGWLDSVAAEPRVVARLQEAGRLLDAALAKGGQVPVDVRVNVRLDRAAVYEAVGQHDQARAELLAISREVPDHPDAVLRYAAALAGEGRTDDAITVLHPTAARPDCPPQVLLLYAQLIAERRREGDRATALDLLRKRAGDWPAAPLPFRIAWVQTFAHLILDAEGANAARSF
jgi:Flp pilus assembly protein TadD